MIFSHAIFFVICFSINMSSGKKRSSNFSLREKEILISLVKKYFHILENKKTNQVFNKQKNEYWERVAYDYNTMQITGPRTAAQLKSTYEQMKKLAKQHKAEDKVGSFQTGGGIYIPKLTPLDDKILDLIKDKYFFIDNKYDCNTDVLQQHTEEIPSERIPGDTQPSTSSDFSISERNVNIETISVIYQDDEYPNENVSSIYDETNENMSSDKHSDNLLWSKSRDRYQCTVNANNKRVNDEIAHYRANETLAPEIDETPRIDPKNKEKKAQNRKMQIWKSKINENKKRNADNIIEKKMKLMDKKISLLDTMQKVEEENLKGKILDNEIKEIIKEKELIDLESKKTNNFDMQI